MRMRQHQSGSNGQFVARKVKKLWLFAPPEMPYQELRRQFEFPELYVDAVEPKPAPRQLDMMDDGFADLQPQE